MGEGHEIQDCLKKVPLRGCLELGSTLLVMGYSVVDFQTLYIDITNSARQLGSVSVLLIKSTKIATHL